MNTIIFIVLVAAFLFAFVTSSLRQMHMFQLNSYSAVKHFRWMRKNVGELVTNIIALLMLAAVIPLEMDNMLKLMAALVFVLFGIVNIPKSKAKKPLAFTTRVIRMFVTEALITAAIVLIPTLVMGSF